MKANSSERSWVLRFEMMAESLMEWFAEKGFLIWMGRLGGAVFLTAAIFAFNKLRQISGLVDGMESTEVGEKFLWFILALLCVAVGAVCLLPSVLPVLAAPFINFIDSVYLGGSSVERPRLTYEVVERLLKERRWDDAAAEFERIAYWHPTEARAYREGVRAARRAGDEALAKRLYRRGVLRCPSAAAELRAVREEAVSK